MRKQQNHIIIFLKDRVTEGEYDRKCIIYKCENVILKPIITHNLVDASDNINCFKGLSVESCPVFLLWLPWGWGGPADSPHCGSLVASEQLESPNPTNRSWLVQVFVCHLLCLPHMWIRSSALFWSWETPFSQENLLNYFPLPDNWF